MAYLLDANVLMEPHRHYYAFDLCPGYWDFLDQAFAAGRIRSIQAVLTECQENADALSAWASARPAFFPPQTAATAIGMSRVSRWVMAHANYTPAAKAAFLGDADAILIAEALGGGHTVVTYETREPNRQVKVKIPDVATRSTFRAFGCRTPFALRVLGSPYDGAASARSANTSHVTDWWACDARIRSRDQPSSTVCLGVPAERSPYGKRGC